VSVPTADDESLLARAVRRRAGDRLSAARDEVGRLLAAGLALMRERPGAEPRIADVVARAGVSNDAFYRAFRGKADLLAAIADDGARRLAGYLRHRRDEAADPAGQVRACVRAVLAQAADPQIAETTRAVLRLTPRFWQREGGVDVRRRLAELLAAPLTALGSPDPDRDAPAAACAVFAVMEQHLWARTVPGAADEDQLTAFVIAAVRRTAGC
jgi:AcrR family transcriptional regulator